MQSKEKGAIETIRLVAIVGSVLVLGFGGLMFIPDVRNAVLPNVGDGAIAELDFQVALPSDLDGTDRYLVCPLDVCVNLDPDQVAETYLMSSASLRDAFFQVLDGQPTARVIRMDMDSNRFDISDLRPGMAYPDAITVQFFAREGGYATLAIYSRTVIGEAAPGRNAGRVTNWLELLDIVIQQNALSN